jgi:putative FmdB family regulatory protein
MPVYEFQCDCGIRFEELISAGVVPLCPACRSANAERIMSRFSISRNRAQHEGAPESSVGGQDQDGPPRDVYIRNSGQININTGYTSSAIGVDDSRDIKITDFATSADTLVRARRSHGIRVTRGQTRQAPR